MLLCIYTSSTLILTILLILNHRSSYDELVQNYKPTYVAGGASQNAARGAAVCIVSHPSPYSSSICACMQTQKLLMSYIVFAPSQLCGLHWLCW